MTPQGLGLQMNSLVNFEDGYTALVTCYIAGVDVEWPWHMSYMCLPVTITCSTHWTLSLPLYVCVCACAWPSSARTGATLRLELASCLIYGQPFRHTFLPRPTPISLTACTHFGARLGAFFYWTRCFENNVPFDNTAQIYLINLHWKLGLGFKLRLTVALF